MTTQPSRVTVRVLAALALVALLCAQHALAQRNPSGTAAARLYQVTPNGGKVGSTVEVVVAGKDIEDADKIVFSNPAIKGELVPQPKPEIDPKSKQPKAVPNALPAGMARYKVTIPAGVPLGNHDVRLINKYGVSNPRVFVVGNFNEVQEKEPNNEADQAQKVELNTTISGNISAATDVDYYAIAAKKGQRIIVNCRASSLDSRLQPAIEVYDSKDRQVAANRNYEGDDAVTDFTPDADGDYFVRVIQFTHTMRPAMGGTMPAGSADHFYRLSINTAPWIDAVVPRTIEAGKTATVTIYGRNLPGGKIDESARIDDVPLEKITMSVTAPAAGKGKMAFSGTTPPPAGWLDGFDLVVQNGSGTSNAFLMGIANAPVVVEKSAHDTPETAQEVTLPCEINGAIEKRRDRDWYSFNAKKGERWKMEMFSSRYGSPTFMTVVIRNPATKTDIYEAPRTDNPQMMQGLSRKFYARSEDPRIDTFVVPADGQYQLLVTSLGDNLYGPRHTYTVRISKEEPDFKLVALSSVGSSPDTPMVPVGGQAAYSVLVYRDEPFVGDIDLSVEGLPAGLTCPPQTLGRSVREASLVISAADNAAEWAGEIKIKGTTTINGQKVTREARAAGVIWPIQANQNITTHSRLERGTWLSVRDKAPLVLTSSIDKAEVVQGDKANLKVQIKRNLADLKGPIQVTSMQEQNDNGRELPIGLTVNNNQPLNVNPGQNDATLAINVPATVPPGTYNIVLRGQTQAPYSKDPMAKQKPPTSFVAPSTPVTITVLPKSLATFTATPQSQNVKIGTAAKVAVRVQRQFQFDGEFKVQLVIPQGVQGVQAAEVTIPAGKDDAELVINVPADATPGNRANLVVKATAMFGKTPVVHQAQPLSINVMK